MTKTEGKFHTSAEDKCPMDYKEAIIVFENNIKKCVVQIERCSAGIANYVFIVSTATERFILRCSKAEEAYKDTVNWLNKLSVCEIPIPIVLSKGTYKDYSYLILSYIPGEDIGNVRRWNEIFDLLMEEWSDCCELALDF